MADVRAKSGVPVLADFGGVSTPTACAPVVVDSATGFVYSWKTGDNIVLAGQGGNVTGANLTASALILGGGNLTLSAASSLGNSTSVLHGNASGAPSFARITSADAAGNVTGTGSFVLANTPTLVTPVLGVANATSVNFGNSSLASYIGRTTWTPTDQSGAALSLTVGNAIHIKVGDLVFVQGYVTYPVTASGAAAVLGGLPFTVSGQGYCSWQANSDAAIADLIARPRQSATLIDIFTTGSVAVTNAQLSGKFVIFSGCFSV